MNEIITFEFDEDLFNELKQLRMELADWKPAFIVASNATLIDLATFKPITKNWFCSIDGLKLKRFELYWDAIISLIRKYLIENGVDVDKLEDQEMEKHPDIEDKIWKNSYKNRYQYWQKNYPWYVVIKLEWIFYTVRWDNAEILQDLLWYKIVDNDFWKFTWWPYREKITDALDDAGYNYIVVEKWECVIERSF